jgi:hypothetical protein
MNPLMGQQGGGAPGVGVIIPTPTPPPTMSPTSTQAMSPPSTETSPPSATDPMSLFKQKLEKLKMMKEMEMISDVEFEAEKKNLLSSL